MSISSTIGKVIHEARIGARLSQGQLAARMDIQRTYISKIEGGKAIPTIRSLETFAKGLGVPAWTLVREAEKASEAAIIEKRKEIGRALGTLPKETR